MAYFIILESKHTKKYDWVHTGFKITFSHLRALLFTASEIGHKVTIILCVCTSIQ